MLRPIYGGHRWEEEYGGSGGFCWNYHVIPGTVFSFTDPYSEIYQYKPSISFSGLPQMKIWLKILSLDLYLGE